MSTTSKKTTAKPATSTTSHRVILYGGLAVGAIVAIVLIRKLRA